MNKWYVSNVSIIFDCSMLLYYLFWMFTGFTLHFYIIFGTNLLTGGQTRIVVFFCLFQCFEGKKYQTEWNLREQSFWNKRNPGDLEWTSRSSRGGHEAGGHAPYPRGPLVAPLTYLLRLYIPPYPENIQGHHGKLFPPPQPSVSMRSHLGAFSGAPPEGESITEGLYIIAKASPMSCEWFTTDLRVHSY